MYTIINSDSPKSFRTMFGSVKPEPQTGDIDPASPMLAGGGQYAIAKTGGDRIGDVTSDGLTKQSGTGDPSPTNIRPIDGIGYQSNLLPNYATPFMQSGVNVIINKDKSITVVGTATADVQIVLFNGSFTLPTGKLILSNGNNAALPTGIRIIMQATGLSPSIELSPGANSIIIDNPANRNWEKFYVKITGGSVVQATIYPTLNRGTVAFPYSPYIGSEYGTEISMSGINILNVVPKTETKSGVTFTSSPDGSITASGTNTASGSVTFVTYINPKLLPGTYYFGIDSDLILPEMVVNQVDGQQRWTAGKIVIAEGESVASIYVYVKKGYSGTNTAHPFLTYGGSTVPFQIPTPPIYRLLPLTSPIYSGDSVDSYKVSGCDKKVVFDGSSDETWSLNTGSGIGPSGSKRFQTKIQFFSANIGVDRLDKKATAYSSYLGIQTPNNTYRAQYENTFSVATNDIHIRVSGIATVDALRTYLAKHPLTVWYRSSDYTPESDIPLCLETHNSSMLVLDGTENWQWDISAGAFWRGWLNGQFPNAKTSLCLCSHAKSQTTSGSNNGCQMATSSFLLALPNIQGEGKLDEFKAYLAEQYAAGTPVQALYELKNPVVYGHDYVDLVSPVDNTGYFVVSGENSITLYIKPLQDGGNAIQLNSHNYTEIRTQNSKSLFETALIQGSEREFTNYTFEDSTDLIDNYNYLYFTMGPGTGPQSIFSWFFIPTDIFRLTVNHAVCGSENDEMYAYIKYNNNSSIDIQGFNTGQQDIVLRAYAVGNRN